MRTEERNRGLRRAGREVHVAHRRLQVGVSGQFLNRSHRSAAHGEMRAERVPELVKVPALWESRAARRALEPALQRWHLHAFAALLPEEALAAKVLHSLERFRE